MPLRETVRNWRATAPVAGVLYRLNLAFPSWGGAIASLYGFTLFASSRIHRHGMNLEQTPRRRFDEPLNGRLFKLVACAIIVVLLSPISQSQETPKSDPVATIAVDVNVISLPVTVRDKHGKIVSDLTKDDFALREDGQPQTIKYFSRESDLPLTLGLLVDTSLSQRNVLDQERNASKTFLDQMMKPDTDKAFIIHFDWEVELLQDLTSNHDKLQSALDLLQTPRLERADDQSGNGGDSSRRGSHHRGGGTALYDAVYLASNELMKKQQGRKAIIVLSDGVDRGSKESLNSAIESAQRADTLVYSILFADDHQDHGYDRERGGRSGGYPGGGYPGGGWPGGGGRGRRGGSRPPQESHEDGKRVLERIAKETGGRFFTVTKKETVGQIYDQIAEELRTQYSLGYTPNRDRASSAGYHHIALEARKKDLIVQTREGYYADR